MKYTDQISDYRKNIPNYTVNSINWLKTSLNKPNNKFMGIDPGKMKIGSFYFMRYDLQKINKSTKMEQFVPFMLVDYKPSIDKKVFWILNLNFFPTNIKLAFFSSFLDKFTNILEDNEKKKDVLQESPIPNINYKNMWNELIKFGFEYSVREIRIELINQLFVVSTDNLKYLTTMNTQLLTGVDDGKLNQIWITKLKNEPFQDRVEELRTIKNNYYAILEELDSKFKNLNKELDGL